jgi:hypothetical protein
VSLRARRKGGYHLRALLEGKRDGLETSASRITSTKLAENGPWKDCALSLCEMRRGMKCSRRILLGLRLVMELSGIGTNVITTGSVIIEFTAGWQEGDGRGRNE